mgnify:CR=1 FL=1
MENLIIPEGYKSDLDLHDTQVAIKTVKDFFQNLLSENVTPLDSEYRIALLTKLHSDFMKSKLSSFFIPLDFSLLFPCQLRMIYVTYT